MKVRVGKVEGVRIELWMEEEEKEEEEEEKVKRTIMKVDEDGLVGSYG